MSKILCIGYILFMVGMATGQVGQIPKSPSEPYPWWLPLSILMIMAVPAALGYMAGKEEETF